MSATADTPARVVRLRASFVRRRPQYMSLSDPIGRMRGAEPRIRPARNRPKTHYGLSFLSVGCGARPRPGATAENRFGLVSPERRIVVYCLLNAGLFIFGIWYLHWGATKN